MKKISNEVYYDLFGKWQGSGLSKAVFAAREGVPKVSFYYWCKKFDSKPEPLEHRSGFTRIGLSPATSPSAVAMISYPSGVSLELFGQLDTDAIKALLF
jgi:hypothetical protein